MKLVDSLCFDRADGSGGANVAKAGVDDPNFVAAVLETSDLVEAAQVAQISS